MLEADIRVARMSNLSLANDYESRYKSRYNKHSEILLSR